MTGWTAAGGAGTPARIAVSEPRVFLTYGGVRDTSAYFRIRNSGGSGDRLVSVSSPGARDVMLGRHTRTDAGAGGMAMVPSLTLPAGRTVTMSPLATNVMLKHPAASRWRPGDRVPFVLRFAHSRPVRLHATVVRPGG
nr:copper chaperone PCu(A)C [Streptomyces boncukensis]